MDELHYQQQLQYLYSLMQAGLPKPNILLLQNGLLSYYVRILKFLDAYRLHVYAINHFLMKHIGINQPSPLL